MTEVTPSTQQLLAIVSASAPVTATVTINYSASPEAVESYENAIAMIEAVGGTVTREAQKLLGTDRPYEIARVNPTDYGTSDFTLIGPFDHAGFDPDERVAVTTEGKLALRVIQGGVA